jgi:hypothetical protein
MVTLWFQIMVGPLRMVALRTDCMDLFIDYLHVLTTLADANVVAIWRHWNCVYSALLPHSSRIPNVYP